MNTNKYEINVLANGRPMREYFHNGRFFIEARKGTEYQVKIKNHSHKRILAVVSVDGIDVLKGGAAASAESGYVVNAYSTVTINGYRLDDNSVATFKFDEDKSSYATLVENDFDEKKAQANGPSRNNGVIGVRIWEEKESKFVPAWKQQTIATHWTSNGLGGNLHNVSSQAFNGLFACSGAHTYTGSLNTRASMRSMTKGQTPSCPPPKPRMTYHDDTWAIGGELLNSSDTAAFMCSTEFVAPKSALQPEFKVGTSWGDKVEDKVTKTQFEKADTYVDLTLYYLTRDELVRIGVDLDNSKKVYVSGFPEAFGGDYCRKPSNWGK